MEAEIRNRLPGLLGNRYLVDYRDCSGWYFHREFSCVGALNALDAGQMIHALLEKEGYQVMSVFELLNGYTASEIEKMGIKQMHQHTRMIFCNPSIDQ